ncbi:MULTISPECIES: ABC transporter ATP-binding protein [unclassified Thioalkalivibrio]|uniref:ABC transporter ATP-binding protein n=1 Tax=unclassified Thioalkalivibrio TaxID=2621013 RepID=UPI0003711FC5|nr:MULTISPECIES: ABC transporter ATP-binding protein [unclassified Thioalkalivibrio]
MQDQTMHPQRPLGSPVLAMSGVAFGYPGEGRVLHDVELALAPGERVAIVGESGSGKSTLLHLAAGLEPADTGTVELAGQALAGLDEAARTRLRRAQVGIVFQSFHLIPTLTALENVMLPLELATDLDAAQRRERAAAQLAAVGLADKGGREPEQLSGGEQQRVAIARALVHRPALILADEPTGNLDSRTGEAVFGLLLEQVRATGCALLLVTHSDDLAGRLDRVLRMQDGHLQDLAAEASAT